MYAGTGDDYLKKNGDTVVAELAKCQKSLNNGGYLSAFPVEFFDRLRNRAPVWAPFYTIHKIMAGNLDMFVHTGNQQALEVVESMANWTGEYTGFSATTTCSAFSEPNRAVWVKCSRICTR